MDENKERIARAYENLLNAEVCEYGTTFKGKGLKITSEDYKILQPLLRARCEIKYTMGKEEIKHEVMFYFSCAQIDGFAYVDMGESGHAKWALSLLGDMIFCQYSLWAYE